MFKNINVWFYLPRWVGRLFRYLGLACYCGSGGHPRRCKKHPWAFHMHITDIDMDSLRSYIEDFEKRIEKLESSND